MSTQFENMVVFQHKTLSDFVSIKTNSYRQKWEITLNILNLSMSEYVIIKRLFFK